MMHKLITIDDGAGKVTGPKVDAEALQQMRRRGGNWAVFQNHAMDSAALGGLRFLQFGEDCTFKVAPKRYPDTQYGIGWKYLLVGRVNLASGEIE
jgi:hypothetical protein